MKFITHKNSIAFALPKPMSEKGPQLSQNFQMMSEFELDLYLMRIYLISSVNFE